METWKTQNTWRRKVVNELKQLNLSWSQTAKPAADRTQWTTLVLSCVPVGTKVLKEVSKYYDCRCVGHRRLHTAGD